MFEQFGTAFEFLAYSVYEGHGIAKGWTVKITELVKKLTYNVLPVRIKYVISKQCTHMCLNGIHECDQNMVQLCNHCVI